MHSVHSAPAFWFAGSNADTDMCKYQIKCLKPDLLFHSEPLFSHLQMNRQVVAGHALGSKIWSFPKSWGYPKKSSIFVLDFRL